jgi:hypothetical protein
MIVTANSPWRGRGDGGGGKGPTQATVVIFLEARDLVQATVCGCAWAISCAQSARGVRLSLSLSLSLCVCVCVCVYIHIHNLRVDGVMTGLPSLVRAKSTMPKGCASAEHAACCRRRRPTSASFASLPNRNLEMRCRSCVCVCVCVRVCVHVQPLQQCERSYTVHGMHVCMHVCTYVCICLCMHMYVVYAARTSAGCSARSIWKRSSDGAHASPAYTARPYTHPGRQSATA